MLLTASNPFSCSSNKQEIDLGVNRDIIKKYYEAKSNRQVAELDKMLAPDFVCHFIKGIEFNTKAEIFNNRNKNTKFKIDDEKS